MRLSATSQDAYDAAYERLFDRLDWLSDRLADRRYLVGDTITEADVRLFTTLVRFDASTTDTSSATGRSSPSTPCCGRIARDLFQTPGFGDTINFEQIKRHYYVVHTSINPTQIVPAGPTCGTGTSNTTASMGGRPFGDGTPPGPPVD